MSQNDDAAKYRGAGFNYKGIYVLQHKEEMDKLLYIMKTAGIKNVLELGYYEGGTALMFDSIIEDGIIVSVDIKERRKNTLKNKSYLVLGDTADPNTVYKINEICRTEGITGFDMLFIDACHEGKYPEHDFNQYRLYLKDNAIAVFHDINDETVAGAYASACKKYPAHEEIRISKDGDWFGIGIIYIGSH